MHAQTLVRAFPFPANALCFVIDVFRRQEHGCRSVAAIALLGSALNESTKLSSTATPFARTRPRLAFSQLFLFLRRLIFMSCLMSHLFTD
jgi:hypothetical protein